MDSSLPPSGEAHGPSPDDLPAGDRLRIAAELHASTLAVLHLLGVPGLEEACETHWHRVEGRHFQDEGRLAFLEDHLREVRALADADVLALRETLPGLVLRDLGRRLQRPK